MLDSICKDILLEIASYLTLTELYRLRCCNRYYTTVLLDNYNILIIIANHRYIADKTDVRFYLSYISQRISETYSPYIDRGFNLLYYIHLFRKEIPILFEDRSITSNNMDSLYITILIHNTEENKAARELLSDILLKSVLDERDYIQYKDKSYQLEIEDTPYRTMISIYQGSSNLGSLMVLSMKEIYIHLAALRYLSPNFSYSHRVRHRDY